MELQQTVGLQKARWEKTSSSPPGKMIRKKLLNGEEQRRVRERELVEESDMRKLVAVAKRQSRMCVCYG